MNLIWGKEPNVLKLKEYSSKINKSLKSLKLVDADFCTAIRPSVYQEIALYIHLD